MNDSNYWLKVDRQKKVFDRHYEEQFYKALQKQLEPILENFEFNNVPSDVIRRVMNMPIEPIQSVYYDLYRRVGVEFAKYAVEALKGYDGNLEVKSDPIDALLDDPDSFTYIWTTQVNSWVIQNVGDRIVSVNETSKKRAIAIIRRITEQAINEGLGIKETMALLEQQIPIEWRAERFRAATIARTEVLTAANEGSYRGAIATGLQLKKVWLTRLDGRERDSHRAANGQERELNQPYDIGGEYLMRPGDINADGSQVINCRCVERYIRV